MPQQIYTGLTRAAARSTPAYTTRGDGDDFTDSLDDSQDRHRPPLVPFGVDLGGYDPDSRAGLVPVPTLNQVAGGNGATGRTTPQIPYGAGVPAPASPAVVPYGVLGPRSARVVDRLAARPLTSELAKANIGHTDAFDASVRNTRALDQYAAGQSVKNRADRTNDNPDRKAAMAAFAAKQAAAADLGTGGFFERRGLVADANERANAESKADVGLADARAKVLVPYGALLESQSADLRSRAGMRNALSPAAADLAAARARSAETEATYSEPRVRAGVNLTQSEANYNNARGAAALQQPDTLKAQSKDQSAELRQAQQRVAHLERILYGQHGSAADQLLQEAGGGAPAPAAGGRARDTCLCHIRRRRRDRGGPAATGRAPATPCSRPSAPRATTGSPSRWS